MPKYEDDSSENNVYPDMTMLPTRRKDQASKKCLLLDLDETLVHSSFKPIPNPDFIIHVEIDRVDHEIYTLKRPGVDEFLYKVSKYYEVVIWTASLAKVCTCDIIGNKLIIVTCKHFIRRIYSMLIHV